MPPARITFAESAVADLEQIRAWYAEQQVPDVGERLLGEIIATVERLADFPESGRIVPEFELPQLREIIHPPFRIVYRLGARAHRAGLARRATARAAGVSGSPNKRIEQNARWSAARRQADRVCSCAPRSAEPFATRQRAGYHVI